MKRILIVLILIVLSLDIFSQKTLSFHSYSTSIDSLMVYLNNNSSFDDGTRLELRNRYQLKKLDSSDILIDLYISTNKFNCSGELNKFPNIMFLHIQSLKKRAVYKEEVKLRKIQFLYLTSFDYYEDIPQFVNQQDRLIGLNITAYNLGKLMICINSTGSLEFLNIHLPYMQKIPYEIVNLENLVELSIYSDLKDNKKNKRKFKDENVILPDNFHKLKKLKLFVAPIDLGLNYMELEKLPNLINLCVDTCSLADFEELELLMSKLMYLTIENIEYEKIELLREMYPDVEIRMVNYPISREEAVEKGLLDSLYYKL